LRHHLLVMASLLIAIPQNLHAAETEPVTGAEVTVESFDSVLSPYGTWVSVYGLGRAWRPNPAFVGIDFRPYSSNGHWVYTDAGWTFVSNDAWGWAPFHYGAWWFDRVYGWVWFPGTHWAPAWVEWRYGGGHVGWAPMPPSGYHFAPPGEWGSSWCFIRTRDLTRTSYREYAVPAGEVRSLLTATQAAPVAAVGGETRYSPGPPASFLDSAGVPTQPVALASMTHALPPVSVHASAPAVSPQPNPVVPHPTETVSREVQEKAISEAHAAEPPEPVRVETHVTQEQETPAAPRPSPVAHKASVKHKVPAAHVSATRTPHKVARTHAPAHATAAQHRSHARGVAHKQ
jgi:hypothetical protein